MYKKQQGNRTTGDRAKYERHGGTCDNPDTGKQRYWIEAVGSNGGLDKTRYISL